MLYAIIATDTTNSTASRAAARTNHLAYVDKLRADGRLILAGPHPAIDSPDPGPAGMSGSLIVAEFDSLDAATAWASNDPYYLAGVFEGVVVKPFLKVLP